MIVFFFYFIIAFGQPCIITQAHCWDNGTPLEETLRTFDDLVRCGKIRYYGFSNVCGWMLQKIVETAKHHNLSHCISLQVIALRKLAHAIYSDF